MTKDTREVAYDIASEFLDQSVDGTLFPGLVNRIEQALLGERERCVKIAESSFKEYHTGYNAGKWIAAAIRNREEKP